MWIIVGLGNPGEGYEHTRHNTGRTLVVGFAKKNKFSEWKEEKKLHALVSSGKMGKERVKLVLPNTFMNKSGVALKPLVANAKQAERLVVLYDDLDVPIGSMKISFGRGSGGHRGLASIITSLRTKNFTRVRVGICPITPGEKLRKPKGDEQVLHFIMSSFLKREQEAFAKVSKQVNKALAMIVLDGRTTAMNKFN